MHRSPYAIACLFALSVAACAAPTRDDAEDVEVSSEELAKSRTFAVNLDEDGCVFPYRTLYVRRGGKMTLVNEATTAVTVFVDWPNRLGEDGGEFLDLAPGASQTVYVPYLETDLYSGGRSLDFPLYCVPATDDIWDTDASHEVRIYR